MQQKLTINNPILPGFNADPCAIRVKDDYYLITSTFNWFPGIPLYHSKDLKNWKLVDHILKDPSQIDLKGNSESCGVWAPQISYNEKTKLFYVVYTNVRNLHNTFFDLNNYLVYSKDIRGPWSKPIYLNSSGFDPSFYHEGNKSWLLNLSWETRPEHDKPGQIIIQEYDCINYKFLGKSKVIWEGHPNYGCVEGPHLFKKNGYYYLTVAEGGTGYGHCVRVYRSKNIMGPYENSKKYSTVLTSRKDPYPKEKKKNDGFLKPYFYNENAVFQKSGHGCFLDTHNGETLLFHLLSRPIMPEMRCVLNRETGVQLVNWENDWPKLAKNNCLPEKSITIKMNETPCLDVTESKKVKFENKVLPNNFYSLKNNLNKNWYSFDKKDSWLSIRGQNSLFSPFDASIISRRVQHFNFEVETLLSFNSENHRQKAGLIIQTGSQTFYYLHLFYDEENNKNYICLSRSLNGNYEELNKTTYNNNKNTLLKIKIKDKILSFYYNQEDETYIKFADNFDATVLSDEFTNTGSGAFDGTFIGMTCQDTDKQSKWAHFKFFNYIII